MDGQLGDEFDEQHVFHHAVGITPLLSKLPMETELVVKVTILPVQDFLYRMPRPFAQADDGPERASEGTATTQAATEKPLDVHR